MMQGQLYRHEAVPYAGQQELLSRCTTLADSAVARDEQLMFLVSTANGDALRGALGGLPDHVTYLDMDEHGRNPARLMTLLDGFRSGADGRPCVGVVEPALAGTSATIAETRLGETVLNSPTLQSWNLAVLCLYDTGRLDATAISDMHRSHPSVRGQDDNPAYEPELAGTLFAEALPAAPPDARGHDVGSRGLAPAREFVRSNSSQLAPDRQEDLVLAANEVVTNSIRHGDGQCRIVMWEEADSVVCEVRDAGRITDPLVGRLAPALEATAGRGLWLANHLCDLVQIRSSQAGTTVRLRMGR